MLFAELDSADFAYREAVFAILEGDAVGWANVADLSAVGSVGSAEIAEQPRTSFAPLCDAHRTRRLGAAGAYLRGRS